MTQRTNVVARHQACNHIVAFPEIQVRALDRRTGGRDPPITPDQTRELLTKATFLLSLVTYFLKKIQSSFTHTSIERARKSDNRNTPLRKKHEYTKSFPTPRTVFVSPSVRLSLHKSTTLPIKLRACRQ